MRVDTAGHDSEAVGRRTAQLDAMADDARTVLGKVRSAASDAARWAVPGDVRAAGLPPAAVALLDAVAATTEAATTALAARTQELRDQALRAREIDQHTADRIRALPADLHPAPPAHPWGGGTHGGRHPSGGNPGGGGRRA
ncbi:hypothetical protein RHODO2019_02425 [Rhodococcus antarcticus]|uniref:Excreted virulence factor EspC (Type VII ESX diderm) n=1 Tax=Rhodococcus antarcticus TaxID=2987751 RepID=A0ABY6P1Z7_9NOCA|nr:hypothetical protein [Rhodococcus antarcticus]UZJ25356.1 hypothetical protein RHODO2019_02425 [Rhodococcus antarcticus]